MLNNKIVIITGGMSGIGLSIAQKLVELPATVVTTSRKINFRDENIVQNSINHQYLDVENESSVNDFFLWIEKQNIELAVLINNAGVGIFKPFTETSLQEWNKVIATNLTGSFLCSKYAFQLMKKFSGGRIINIGSVVELAGITDNSAYAASKSGLRALSLVISEEGRKFNITATHISLGAIYSDIWKNRLGFSANDMLDVEQVANTIKYIVSLPSSVRMDYLEVTPPKKIL